MDAGGCHLWMARNAAPAAGAGEWKWASERDWLLNAIIVNKQTNSSLIASLQMQRRRMGEGLKRPHRAAKLDLALLSRILVTVVSIVAGKVNAPSPSNPDILII